MQRKIFSINRISKVRGDFNKLLALISLALGTACMQIMLSPIFAQAATYNSDGKLAVGSGDGDKGGGDYSSFYVAILMGLVFIGWIIYNVWVDKAADKRMEEIYQSLPPELQLEYNEQFRDIAVINLAWYNRIQKTC
jgi:hypothetical protein